MLVHATSVSVAGQGVLLTGPSGIGKSDLALRLIHEGAVLIADDQTFLHCEKGTLLASAPPPIEGMIEIRHIGIARVPFVSRIPVSLYVELVLLSEEIERLPHDDFVFLLDQSVRRLRLPAFALSTSAKISTSLKWPLIQ